MQHNASLLEKQKSQKTYVPFNQIFESKSDPVSKPDNLQYPQHPGNTVHHRSNKQRRSKSKAAV